MPSKTCLSACAYIWELWWNRQIISKRGKQVRSKKHQWITTANRSLKKFLSFFFSLSFFRLPSPLLFSSCVHAPCAHYKDKKRQVCIILNEFVVVVVHLALAALLKQDGVRSSSFFFSLSFSSSSPPPHPHPHPFFSLHRFMRLALIIRRGTDKYAFLLL